MGKANQGRPRFKCPHTYRTLFTVTVEGLTASCPACEEGKHLLSWAEVEQMRKLAQEKAAGASEHKE